MERKCEYQNTKTWCVHEGKRWDNYGAGMEVVSLDFSHLFRARDLQTLHRRPMEVTTWTQRFHHRYLQVRKIEVRRAAGLMRTPRLCNYLPLILGNFPEVSSNLIRKYSNILVNSPWVSNELHEHLESGFNCGFIRIGHYSSLDLIRVFDQMGFTRFVRNFSIRELIHIFLGNCLY